MGRSSSYYDDFQRYGRRSQYDYRRHLPSYRESDEERASGKQTRDEHMKNVTEENKKDMTLPTEMMIPKKERLTTREVKVTRKILLESGLNLLKKQCRQFLKTFLLNLLPSFVPAFKQSSTGPHTKLGKVLPLFKVDSLSGA